MRSRGRVSTTAGPLVCDPLPEGVWARRLADQSTRQQTEPADRAERIMPDTLSTQPAILSTQRRSERAKKPRLLAASARFRG